MNVEQTNALLYEALETEKGGMKIYKTAIQCAINNDLKEEWQEYLKQTENHYRVITELVEKMGLDPKLETPGRKIVRHIGDALVKAMKMAQAAGNPEAAQLVAAECVVLAETKDHMNWELIGRLADKAKGAEKKALKAAHDEVEDEEDEHIYHTKGWTRELWIKSLGMRAVLPPPEEEREVKTAIGAARAEKARTRMM